MNLKADTDALAALAQTLSKNADAIAGKADDLAAASLTLRSRWTGDAQGGWALQHSQIDARMRDRAGALKLTAKRVARYAEDIAKADEAGARAILGL